MEILYGPYLFVYQPNPLECFTVDTNIQIVNRVAWPKKIN